METSDALSTNGELETRRVKEINDNDLDAAPVKLPKRRRPKFGDHHDLESMKSNIHDKGTQLSTVWNELYNLLGDYQAKLFSREGEFLASKAKYDAVTDMDQLRNDLISKDNEVKELKERLSVMESRSETIQLDLSVKNSLLKKYQQDLLDKEAALLNLQSANKKLENRVQALEMKLAGSVAISTQSPQPGTSGARQASTPPQLKRRGALPPQHSTPKRRPLLPAIAPKPATNLEPETRDEDSSQKLSPPSDARDNNVENRENENSVNIPLYAEQWIKSETPTTMDEDENSNQNVFPGNENEVEEMAQWQGQDSGLDGEGSLMIDSPSNKDPSSTLLAYHCEFCGRSFAQKSSLKRHLRTVHLKIHPYMCPYCPKTCGQRSHLNAHLVSRHSDVLGNRAPTEIASFVNVNQFQHLPGNGSESDNVEIYDNLPQGFVDAADTNTSDIGQNFPEAGVREGHFRDAVFPDSGPVFPDGEIRADYVGDSLYNVMEQESNEDSKEPDQSVFPGVSQPADPNP